jgi:hypothetical protein
VNRGNLSYLEVMSSATYSIFHIRKIVLLRR